METGEEATALAAGVAELGLRVAPAAQERLLAFLAELRRWNRAYNLVAEAPVLDWVRSHLLDSLSIAAPLRVLARKSHQLSAADANLFAVARRTPSSRFDVGAATPSAPFGPCALPPRHLDALATKVGEISGPATDAGHGAAFSAGVLSRAESPRSRGRSPRSAPGSTPGTAPPAGPFRVLDLGSGAGLPGIPLALALPELRFVLLDGNGKKARFCRHAVLALGLPNVEVVEGRAEGCAPSPPFDAAVVRAVGSLARVRELVRPCCRGPILAMKGRYPARELEELEGVLFETARLRVPGLEAERHLVILR